MLSHRSGLLRRGSHLVLFLAAPWLAFSAKASLITISVTGVVTQVSHTGQGWPFPNMAVGDHFSASFEYDTNAVDTDPAPNAFLSFTSLAGFSVTSGAVTVSESGSAHTTVSIVNDGQPPQQTPGDYVSMSNVDTGEGFLVGFTLAGDTRPLSSVVLPDGQNLGLLPGWEPVAVCQDVGLPPQSGCLEFGSFAMSGSGSFLGKIDVVPEPGTLILLGVGLSGLVMVGRTKRG